jgi:trans-aconitate 2-methyltransferase
MTEWDPELYRRVSALQQHVAERSLSGLELAGDERVLDVGCGDGRITAEIAGRLPRGSAMGVDASESMIRSARATHAARANLSFEVADAASLGFAAEFDVAVSFNALHWVHDQAAALGGIAAALRPHGRALLRFVPAGARRSLEDVIDDTRGEGRWGAAFEGFRSPFVHPAPEAWRKLAESCGLAVERLEVHQEAWDFGSRDAFARFATATFVEWTRMLPPEARPDFIAEALDRYAALDAPGRGAVFTFYQLEARLRR